MNHQEKVPKRIAQLEQRLGLKVNKLASEDDKVAEEVSFAESVLVRASLHLSDINIYLLSLRKLNAVALGNVEDRLAALEDQLSGSLELIDELLGREQLSTGDDEDRLPERDGMLDASTPTYNGGVPYARTGKVRCRR